MKIKITTVVDIDPKKWAEEFHLEKKEVRDDVKIYFDGFCKSQVEALGVEKEN
jgi:hypothetical protein